MMLSNVINVDIVSYTRKEEQIRINPFNMKLCEKTKIENVILYALFYRDVCIVVRVNFWV